MSFVKKYKLQRNIIIIIYARNCQKNMPKNSSKNRKYAKISTKKTKFVYDTIRTLETNSYLTRDVLRLTKKKKKKNYMQILQIPSPDYYLIQRRRDFDLLAVRCLEAYKRRTVLLGRHRNVAFTLLHDGHCRYSVRNGNFRLLGYRSVQSKYF